VSVRVDLPVLDVRPPAGSARPGALAHPEVAEYAIDENVQPRFHMWTLGCQMNASDAEEMAGSLMAAGCAEAPRLEDADLIVINTCSIREAAEQKVIGRMGALARLKETRPGVRVVLTGCSVRADNEAVLQRRYPAVDLFLRPDEEPELTARLGLAAPTVPGELGGEVIARVGRSVAATADRLPGTRAAAVAEGRIARRRGVQAWLPIIYGCSMTSSPRP
jgi:tRNA-2-methylthio-N6-dimethylallyladenosine synthase